MDRSGNKARFQYRHLLLTLSETCEAFKKENPDVEIGKSPFMNLRPKWALLSSQMPHNARGRVYHSNVTLLLGALHRKCPGVVPLYSSRDFMGKCVCSVTNGAFMKDECETCMGGKLFELNFIKMLMILMT